MIDCPCGAGDYASCCQPLHRGLRYAESPEQLMRSRYSAYALGEDDYVFRTWHPRTRPDDVHTETTWLGLRLIDAHDDIVEFEATHADGVLHEVSRFEQRRGRWVYVEAID